MPQKDFLPARDEALSLWAINFGGLIAISAASYGLVLADSTALNPLISAFTTSLSAAKNPTTRTPASVAAKSTARAQLSADIRALVKRIQSNNTITAAQKVSLGITVPSHVRTPVAPPVTRPVLSVANMASRSLTLRVSDESTPTKRAKPAGCEGANVYSFVALAGTPPPADLSSWTYKGLARKADFNCAFEAGDVGKVAHIRALWINSRGAGGPVSDEITGSIAA